MIHEYVEDRDRSLDVGRPREVAVAIVGLRHLGADAAPAMELLVDVLAAGADRYFEHRTIETLGNLGEVAEAAVPRLRELSTTTTNGRTRRLANEALESISSKSQDRAQGGHVPKKR